MWHLSEINILEMAVIRYPKDKPVTSEYEFEVIFGGCFCGAVFEHKCVNKFQLAGSYFCAR